MIAGVLPMGDRALLVEVASLDAVLALHAALAASAPAGVVDLVPAARTVLVRLDPAVLDLAATRRWIAEAADDDEVAAVPAAPPEAELELVYDGPDLASTADLLGVGTDELVRRHRAASWTVAFTGFAPGFGYLVSADWPFDVPRLDAPRTRVPAGAVGLAAGFTGAYPRATPGGWRLIGTTRARLFDPDAASPALLAPGTRVRIRAAAPVTASPPPAAVAGVAPGSGPRPDITVLAPGPQATVQDLGRPGRASLGVAAAGALDRPALRLANRLVGNDEGAAGIEVTLGGFRAVASRDLWFALTGAIGPATLDGRAVPLGAAVRWAAGAELSLDWFDAGARAYLAVRGGIDGAVVLGSRATDVLAGFGRPLAAGEAVAVGEATAGAVPALDFVPLTRAAAVVEVELLPGPRADWFSPAALDTLFAATWAVGTDADRVGARLEGPLLERIISRELPSEGMVAGALQVPPSGRPTVLLADGPVTGGYPVIAVATTASLAVLAQARPGTRVRFRRARRGG